MKGYLQAVCHASGPEATRERKIAAVLDACPPVGDALLAGRIGVSQVLEFARIHANPRIREYLPAVAEILLERAEHQKHAEFRLEVDEFIMFADSDGAFEHIESNIEHRNARVTIVGETLDIVATGGDPLTAERVVAIFERFVQAEFHADIETRRAEHGDDADQHPLRRTAAQRRHDAVIKVFDTAAAAEHSAGAADPLVNIVIDHDTLDEAFTRSGITLPDGDVLDVDDAGDVVVEEIIAAAATDPTDWLDRRCHTSAGTAVHPRLVLQAAMTAHIRRVVVDSSGVVIDYGRSQRLFSGNARLAARLLSPTCTHPGCTIRADQCDVDHIDGWTAGGNTDQHNSDIRCGPHDRFKHRHRWRTRRDSNNRTVSVRPDGSMVLAVGQRPPDISADELGRIARQRLAELVTSAA